MKSLFSEDTVSEIRARIELLQENQNPKWGKMNASQMLAHCKFPLQVALGELALEKPNVFKRLLFSMFKSSLYDDKAWKQSLPTTKEFVVSSDKNFRNEKTDLLEEIEKFHTKKDQTEWPPHPMFGYFTQDQWGKMQYKHLDHHLNQFGV
ncbi:DUF1569 domain-containing protein [Hanstruepera flava]|uniref:DUF1569 domain-containing protein n=1 Tax=Hanstruepera flava TaxID=2930218 RepID=UPI00202920C9|nr:DUF1569 domain-containing protein [Hanstruepera flava]